MAPTKYYTPKQMGDAIAAVQGGEPVATAAKRFGIPRITLRNKTTGISPMQCRMGPATVLTSAEEDLLVKWLIAMAARRFPISKDILLDSVQRIITETNRTNPFTGNRPGRKWFASFLSRHPEIAKRTAENITASRENVTEEQIVSWFREVEEYLTSVGLNQALEDPCRVFNTDESAFFFSPKPGQVLVKRGEKHIYSASGDEKENLTVLVTANAAGKLAPPMIVYAYERIPAYIANSVPDDWGIGKSESGWMCSDTFFEYITSVFNPWLIKEQIPKPVLFFVDGHKSHLTLQLSKFCSENGIEVIALYPNSTHILQPMDISVFRPLKVYFRKEVVAWRTENMGNNLKKEHFAPVFKRALDKITDDCIKNGFRGGGLHPFGPEYIDMSKFSKLPTIADLNEQKDQTTAQTLTFLESQIKNIFGRDKLDMYNKLYFEGRNSLENRTLDDDLNLYILWAHIKQMIMMPNTNEVTTSSSSIESGLDQQQRPKTVQNDEVILNRTEATSPSVLHQAESIQDVEMIPYIAGVSDQTTLTPNTNVTLSATASTSSTHEQATNVESTQAAFDFRPCSSKTTEPNNNIPDTETIPYLAKNDFSIALGVTVPSPFKKCLFWPDKPEKKNTRKKEKLPSAVTSIAWQQYHARKDAAKKRLFEEKEMKAKIRLEKKELKEKVEREKKEKRKAKHVRVCDITSSEDTDMEVTYNEIGESEINEQSDPNMSEEEIQTLEQQSETRKIRGILMEDSDSTFENYDDTLVSSKEKDKKGLKNGCYVIVRYEGEYFPGKIENIDKGQYEISTMVLSTGNSFRWPERPDKIWYKINDVIEKISPPVKQNNRGFFKVAEMEKFLPDIYDI